MNAAKPPRASETQRALENRDKRDKNEAAKRARVATKKGPQQRARGLTF